MPAASAGRAAQFAAARLGTIVHEDKAARRRGDQLASGARGRDGLLRFWREVAEMD